MINTHILTSLVLLFVKKWSVIFKFWCADDYDDSAVTVLEGDNFAEFITNNPEGVLVNFCVPFPLHFLILFRD